MLSGWAAMDVERQFEYRESLDNFSKEELISEVMFHFTDFSKKAYPLQR